MKLGDILYLLKTELHGPQGQRVLSSLPCPESELTQWLAASRREISGAKLSRLVRSSPTLFLLAVSRASACTNAPIQSMVQLLGRLDHCFAEGRPIETLLGHIVEITEVDAGSLELSPECHEALSSFRQARNRKQLTKSLTMVVRGFNRSLQPKKERASKADIKKLVRSMFVESFRIERLKPRKVQWPDESNSARCEQQQAALLGLLEERQFTKQAFETELLNAKLSAMKQLAYGASHEINNPLANIATRAQTMLADEADPDRRFQLAVMHEQAMRAHDMISDMMLFAHPPALKPESVDVRRMVIDLIRECESNLLPVLRSNAQITATICPGIGLAKLDPTQCKVALACLIQNAAEAIRHDDGEIDLRVGLKDGQLCFEVSDNGIGISEQVRQHLFDPFYSGREAGRGLGFGLSKSWRIAKLHGGSLTHRIDSEDIRTVFELSIPQR